MDVQQPAFIKHTFIDIDTRTTRDVRKVLTWSGPCIHRSFSTSSADDASTISSDDDRGGSSGDSTWPEEPADDWISDVCRLKTGDPLDFVQSSVSGLRAEVDSESGVCHLLTSDSLSVEQTSAVAWRAEVDSEESLITQIEESLVDAGFGARSPQRWESRPDDSLSDESLIGTEPDAKTTEKVSFWSSWNLSANAKKAMQDRVAISKEKGESIEGMHRLSGTTCTMPPPTPTVFRQVPVAMPVREAEQAPAMWIHTPVLCHIAPQFLQQVYPDRSFAQVETRERSGTSSRVDRSTWTCRMLRNLPNDYTRQDVLELLDSRELQYDFFYLPVDWGKRANFGYAFVNLVSHEEAERIEELLNGFAEWKVPSEKICEVVWSKTEQQNLHSNIERFRNNPLMHPDVPEEFKPLLFTLGHRTAFPAPTKRLQVPQGFHRYTSENKR